MRKLMRLACALGLVAALVPTQAAHADDPVFSIGNVTMTPVDYEDGKSYDFVVNQIISWTGGPISGDFDFKLTSYSLGQSMSDTRCGGGGGGYYGTCFHMEPAGQVAVQLRPHYVEHAAYAGAGFTPIVHHTEVRLSAEPYTNLARGAVSLTPKADLSLSVSTPDDNTLKMTVFNLGPSASSATSKLKISGFLEPVSLDDGPVPPGTTRTCAASGLTITCDLSTLRAVRQPAASCQPTASPPTCAQLTLTMHAGWAKSKLTVEVSGPFPDPAKGSNTATAFSAAAPPIGNPPPGGSGNQPPPGQAQPLATITPSIAPSAEAAPPAADVPVLAGPPAKAKSAFRHVREDDGPTLLWAWLAGGVLLAAGGLAATLLMRRRRAKVGTPSVPTP